MGQRRNQALKLVGAEEASDMQEWRKNVARTRIDYRWTKDGRVRAILTVTFGAGTSFRFVADSDPRVIMAVIREQNPEVGGFLGNVFKGIKKIAKKVASSKVFKLAATALAAAAPIMGPLAPALAGAALAMKVSTKLLAAKTHAARGNKEAAAKLVASAAEDSKQAEGGKVPPKMVHAAGAAHAEKVYALLLKPA